MKKLFLTLVVLFVCIGYLQATEYYVSLNGSDSRTGISKAQAWYSFDYAMSLMKPGDVMIIEDGVYSQSINVSKSGTASAPIIIRGRSRNGVVILGTTGGINISNKDYVTIEDVTVRGGSQGVYVTGSNHVTLRRVDVFETVQVGMYFKDNNDDFLITECRVENMTGSGNNGWGIRLYDKNGPGTGKGIVEKCSIRHGWRAGVRVEKVMVDFLYNIVEGWGGDGERDHGIYYGNPAPVYKNGATSIIEGNIFKSNHGYGLKISCWYDPANIIVRNNIFAENLFDGLSVEFGVDGVKVYNNTFYNNKRNTLQLCAYNYKSNHSNKNIKIKNNLFYSDKGNLVLLMDDSLEGLEMDYNCYYSAAGTKFITRKNPKIYTSYSSFSAWQNNNIAPSTDEHSIFQDPRLTNPEQGDYTIQSNSPCIDFGIALDEVSYDFDHVFRPQGIGYDIGAYEYSSGNSSAETVPPYTTGHNPSKNTSSVPINTNIVVHIKDNGSGVDQSSIVMTVKGDQVSPIITGTSVDYTLIYDPPVDFGYNQQIFVTIDAKDLANPPNAMPQNSYSFTTANINTNSPDVMIWLEAESGVLTDPMQIITDMNASGNHYIYVPNGSGSDGNGKSEYKITIPKTGNYIIWGRVLASTGGDDSFYILMDGDRERLWDCLYDGQSSQWKWDQVTERGNGAYNNPQYDPAIFTLTEGEHTLVVKEREDGTQLDRLLLTTDFDYVPDEYSTISEISTTVPEQFNLQQNYPNPFNSETAISYQIPISSHVTIEVFNFMGQKLRTLVNEESNAGTYHAIWNGLDNHGQPVSSGIYFYEMRAGNFTAMKKMLLVR